MKETPKNEEASLDVYPTWVCNDCGLKASGGKCFTVSTFHMSICDVCKEDKAVTEPRDFYYPDFIKKD